MVNTDNLCKYFAIQYPGELIMRQLTRRICSITPEIQMRIQSLSIAQLEDLGEALLDFSQPTDLTTWLNSHQS